MDYLYLVFLSVLQGVTELFPVSSLGHTILVPALFGAPVDTKAPQLIPFLVTLHLGTVVALIWAFRGRWLQLVRGSVQQLRGQPNSEGKLAGLLILATIPAGLAGLILQKPLERIFHDVRLVAVVLLLNGLALIVAERYRARLVSQSSTRPALERLTVRQALLIGVSQIFALVPGFSRSGFTMAAGLGLGLARDAAAEFSFLLGVPIILAATVLELPKLFHNHAQLTFALLGGVLTGIAAYLSIRFLMRFFENGQRLTVFGGYCFILGGASVLWLSLK